MTTTKCDPYIIPMCPEHPQNLKWIDSISVSEKFGWEGLATTTAWRKPLDHEGTERNARLKFSNLPEDTLLSQIEYLKRNLIHIPTNIAGSSDGPTTWDCMCLEVEHRPGTIISVNYQDKTMNICELDSYKITKGPQGKVNKYFIYGPQLIPLATYNGSYWDIVSFSKYENRGFFNNNKDACQYAVNLLAIDKAKIDMEMLRVQLQLI